MSLDQPGSAPSTGQQWAQNIQLRYFSSWARTRQSLGIAGLVCWLVVLFLWAVTPMLFFALLVASAFAAGWMCSNFMRGRKLRSPLERRQ